jgi:hypothetical protein
VNGILRSQDFAFSRSVIVWFLVFACILLPTAFLAKYPMATANFALVVALVQLFAFTNWQRELFNQLSTFSVSGPLFRIMLMTKSSWLVGSTRGPPALT